MKKAILSMGIASSLLLLLIGCNGAQSEHMEEVPEETVKIEETQPMETDGSIDKDDSSIGVKEAAYDELVVVILYIKWSF